MNFILDTSDTIFNIKITEILIKLRSKHNIEIWETCRIF